MNHECHHRSFLRILSGLAVRCVSGYHGTQPRARCFVFGVDLFPSGDDLDAFRSGVPLYYFGFGLFDDILSVINERAYTNDDHMFKAGVASCEAAVRRLREEYYNIVKRRWQDQSYVYIKPDNNG